MEMLKTFNVLMDDLREDVLEVTELGEKILHPDSHSHIKEFSKTLLRLISATRDLANLNMEAAASLAAILEIIIRRPWLTAPLVAGATILNKTLHKIPLPSEEDMRRFVDGVNGKSKLVKVTRGSEKQDPLVNLFNSAYSDKPVPFKDLIDELEGKKARKI